MPLWKRFLNQPFPFITDSLTSRTKNIRRFFDATLFSNLFGTSYPEKAFIYAIYAYSFEDVLIIFAAIYMFCLY